MTITPPTPDRARYCHHHQRILKLELCYGYEDVMVSAVGYAYRASDGHTVSNGYGNKSFVLGWVRRSGDRWTVIQRHLVKGTNHVVTNHVVATDVATFQLAVIILAERGVDATLYRHPNPNHRKDS